MSAPVSSASRAAASERRLAEEAAAGRHSRYSKNDSGRSSRGDGGTTAPTAPAPAAASSFAAAASASSAGAGPSRLRHGAAGVPPLRVEAPAVVAVAAACANLGASSGSYDDLDRLDTVRVAADTPRDSMVRVETPREGAMVPLPPAAQGCCSEGKGGGQQVAPSRDASRSTTRDRNDSTSRSVGSSSAGAGAGVGSGDDGDEAPPPTLGGQRRASSAEIIAEAQEMARHGLAETPKGPGGRGVRFGNEMGTDIDTGRDRPVADETIRIRVGTWNMGAATPDYERLGAWLSPNATLDGDSGHVGLHGGGHAGGGHSGGGVSGGGGGGGGGGSAASGGRAAPIDLYAIGVQECASDEWSELLGQHLGSSYVLVAERAMGQIKLACFVHRRHIHAIAAVETSYTPTGVLGIGKNKGGVALALHFRNQRLCFVNAHLAAHQEKKLQRNQDVRNILRSTRLGSTTCELTAQYHTIWMGDLNYRVENHDRAQAVRLIEEAQQHKQQQQQQQQ